VRVSEFQTFGLFVSQLQRARADFQKLQDQLSSGKRVRTPSDDPVAFGQIVSDKERLAVADQRLRNVRTVAGRVNATDGTLGSVNDILIRLKELAVQMRDDTISPSDRETGAVEARQLFRELRSLANTVFNGQPLFAGTGAHGRAVGLAVTTPATVTGGSNDTLTLTVDGVSSGTVTLAAGAYAGASALATQVQSAINGDAALRAAGKSVTVAVENGRLVVASNGTGAGSAVELTGGTALATIGFDGGSVSGGADPFALSAAARPAAANTGGGVISQGKVRDPKEVAFNNYLIRFTSAAVFDVVNTSARVATGAGGTNQGGAVASEAGVIDPSIVTLDNYEIRFTSDTQYSVVNTTTGATLSSGNAYVSGGNIDFGGLRVVLRDGSAGAPKNGDTFSVSQQSKTVLSGQTYVSGRAVSFEGLEVVLRTGTAAPAAGDRFTVVTGAQYQGNSGLQAVEIFENQTVNVNLPGGRVFSGPTVDLFAKVKNLVDALAGNFGQGIEQAIADVDDALDQVSDARGETGALSNFLTRSQTVLEDVKALVTTALSENQDVDFVKAVSDLTLQQQAIQAMSLAGTRIFETSLLQFLR
jgi:flagellin-like hook-associated protein FlgL